MKPSALARRLTDEQRIQLVHDAQSMVEQYRAEMEAHYYPERREWERQENDDFSSRLSGDPENPQRIFDLSNEPLNIVRNVTRFMTARTKEDIFGSQPYLAVTSPGTMNQPLAEQINRHAPWKLEQASFSKIGKEAIGLALNLGEAILKTTHLTDLDPHEKLDLVLCFKKNGQPVVHGLTDADGAPLINADGEQEGVYIYPEDATTEIAGVEVYASAPEIPADDTTEFREVLVEENSVRYHGPDCANVRFDALIASLTCPTLDDSPAVCHEYAWPLSKLRAAYWSDDEETKWLFEQLATEPEGPKTAEDRPRATFGEVSAGRQRLQNNPEIKVQEIYLRNYDVFGDGKGRNIFLVLVADRDEPLYLEYLANITPKGKLPLKVIAVNRVPGRWYGRSFNKLYRHHQNLIDALVNAIIYRNENNADPLVCWQPDATEEGKQEKRLIRRPGKTITLRAGKSAKDAVQIVEFPDLDDRTWELVQLLMQLIQTDSGVTSASQGDYSSLPSASTATGVSSILQSASTLHRMLTEDLKEGFEPALLFAIEVIYQHQDKDELFRYLEGHAAEILSLSNARQLAELDLNVRLLLDRFQMREQREQAQLVITQVLPAWINALQVSGLPLAGVAQCARPLFVQVAKGADINAPEAIFLLPDRPPPAPPAPPRMTEAISLKGADLAPNQKDALAQQYGLPPAQAAPAAQPGQPVKPGQQLALPAGPGPDAGAAPALPLNVIPAPTDGGPGTPAPTDAAPPESGEATEPKSGEATAEAPSQDPGELDEDKARQFVQQAGGDNDKARALARAAGHKF